MHEINRSHCEFPFGVKQELIGKRLRCPSCKELFTVPVPSGKRRERSQFEDASAREVLDAPDRSSSRRRRKKRKSREDGAKSGSPAEAMLWLGGGAILLFGILMGLTGGYFLFSHAEAFAQLDTERSGESAADSEESGVEADAPIDDPNSPRQMILGKWVGGLGGQMTYEFFKDGAMTVVYAKKTSPGEYKILSADSIWIKGSTGEATMDMKLTPDELELTLHSKFSVDSKSGDGPSEKKSESMDITLKFKRPGAAGETAGGSGPGPNPKEPSSPASDSAKGSPAKPQQSKGSPGSTGRSKR